MVQNLVELTFEALSKARNTPVGVVPFLEDELVVEFLSNAVVLEQWSLSFHRQKRNIARGDFENDKELLMSELQTTLHSLPISMAMAEGNRVSVVMQVAHTASEPLHGCTKSLTSTWTSFGTLAVSVTYLPVLPPYVVQTTQNSPFEKVKIKARPPSPRSPLAVKRPTAARSPPSLRSPTVDSMHVGLRLQGNHHEHAFSHFADPEHVPSQKSKSRSPTSTLPLPSSPAWSELSTSPDIGHSPAFKPLWSGLSASVSPSSNEQRTSGWAGADKTSKYSLGVEVATAVDDVDDVDLGRADAAPPSPSIPIPGCARGARPGTPRPLRTKSMSPSPTMLALGLRSPEGVAPGGAPLFPASCSPASVGSPKNLVGSFEESILCGRMSTHGLLRQEDFNAIIGVSCVGPTPRNRTMSFEAVYYDHGEDTVPPYAATLPIGSDKTSLYRIPPKGKLQVAISNRNGVPIHVFLTDYDVTDMSANTKTVVRHKKTTRDVPAVLKYAVQLGIVCPKPERYYLYNIRVVFSLEQLRDSDLDCSLELPRDPRYFPLEKKRKRRSKERSSTPSHERAKEGVK